MDERNVFIRAYVSNEVAAIQVLTFPQHLLAMMCDGEARKWVEYVHLYYGSTSTSGLIDGYAEWVKDPHQVGGGLFQYYERRRCGLDERFVQECSANPTFDNYIRLVAPQLARVFETTFRSLRRGYERVTAEELVEMKEKYEETKSRALRNAGRQPVKCAAKRGK